MNIIHTGEYQPEVTEFTTPLKAEFKEANFAYGIEINNSCLLIGKFVDGYGDDNYIVEYNGVKGNFLTDNFILK